MLCQYSCSSVLRQLLCLYIEKIMSPIVIIHELNATDWLWLFYLLSEFYYFPLPSASCTNSPHLEWSQQDGRPYIQGRFLKTNNAVTRASGLQCPDHCNSLRAVLLIACVTLCHYISHFFKVVPFALLNWVLIKLLPTGPNVFSLSLGICHGNQ